MDSRTALSEKAHVSGGYLCQSCGCQFPFISGELKCPRCGCVSSLSMVAIYVEYDPEEEELHGKDDWSAGD